MVLRRFLLFGPLCAAAALALALGVRTVAPLTPSPINPASFHRLREGMTEQEVAATIGLPDGDYRTWQTDIGGFNAIDAWGPLSCGKTKWWHGNNYWISVGFVDGEMVQGRVGEMLQAEQSLLTTLRRRLRL